MSMSLSESQLDSLVFQMRLDFTNFQISGPSTLTLSIGKNIGGQVGSPTGVLVSQKTTCATDSFSISNAPGVPVSFLNK